jgi:siroheme synthase-like protein
MKTTNTQSYYPVFLNINGLKCTVVGGGQVALRKVEALLKHGASIEVISNELCTELSNMARSGKIIVRTKKYEDGDLDNAFLAIAATSDNRVNQEVTEEARRKRILINSVDDAVNSDFITPAYLQRGNLIIAISTAGSSPALARSIRGRLEKEFGEEYASLACLIEEVRNELKSKRTKVDSQDWQKALDIDAMIALIKRGEKEKAKALLLDKLKVQ